MDVVVGRQSCFVKDDLESELHETLIRLNGYVNRLCQLAPNKLIRLAPFEQEEFRTLTRFCQKLTDRASALQGQIDTHRGLHGC